MRPAGVVLELGDVGAALLLGHVAIEEQHVRECALECLDRVRHLGDVRADQIRELLVEGVERGVVRLARSRGVRVVTPLVQSPLHERVEAPALLVVVEDHHLAAQRQVFAHMRDDLGGLDCLEQIAAREVIELLVDCELQRIHPATIAASLCNAPAFLAQPGQRRVDARADGRIHEDESAVVVERHVEHAPRDRALLFQPAVELALHQAAVDLGVGLGELVVAHPVAQVLHEEALAVAAVVVAAERPRLARLAFVVVEQVAVGPIDRLLVGEGCRRQEHGARPAGALAGLDVGLERAELLFELAAQGIGLVLHLLGLRPLALVVGRAQHLGVGREPVALGDLVAVEHFMPAIHAVRVQGDRT